MADRPRVLVEAATRPDADIVVNAVVGAAGLDATLAALRAGKRVALANKETLVMAGDLVREAACAGGGEIVPVDSEHSAVLQCVTGRDTGIGRLILTCSGGPFREWPAERVREATVEEALRHPTWRMGHKITVDSATLANKALEVIEAHHLFRLGYDALEVVVHPAEHRARVRRVLRRQRHRAARLSRRWSCRSCTRSTHPERLPDTGHPAVRSGGGRAADVRAGALGRLPRAGRRPGGGPRRRHRPGRVQRRQRGGGRRLPRRSRYPSGGSARSSSRCSTPTPQLPPPPSRRCGRPTDWARERARELVRSSC